MSVVRPLIVLAVLIAGWEIYVAADGIDEFLLPAPSDVGASLWEDRSLLADNLWVTAYEVLLGIAVAVSAGILAAVAIHVSPTLRRSVYPLLVASQTIPIVIIAPVLVAWLGFGLAPKLVIIGIICFFPVAVTTLNGLGSVDEDQHKLLRTLGASRWQRLRMLELPAALPGLFSGAKIAVAIAVIGAVFAEQAGSSEGLGHLIQQALPAFETARAYAAVLLLSLLAIALFGALALAERRLLPWARPSRGNHP